MKQDHKTVQTGKAWLRTRHVAVSYKMKHSFVLTCGSWDRERHCGVCCSAMALLCLSLHSCRPHPAVWQSDQPAWPVPVHYTVCCYAGLLLAVAWGSRLVAVVVVALVKLNLMKQNTTWWCFQGSNAQGKEEGLDIGGVIHTLSMFGLLVGGDLLQFCCNIHLGTWLNSQVTSEPCGLL